MATFPAFPASSIRTGIAAAAAAAAAAVARQTSISTPRHLAPNLTRPLIELSNFPEFAKRSTYYGNLVQSNLPMLDHIYHHICKNPLNPLSAALFNPANSNTWEQPQKYGSTIHLAQVFLSSLLNQENVLSLFSADQQKVIKSGMGMPSLERIMQMYAAVHDSKDLAIFSDVPYLTPKNKALETLFSRIKLVKLYLSANVTLNELIDDLAKEILAFIEENPEYKANQPKNDIKLEDRAEFKQFNEKFNALIETHTKEENPDNDLFKLFDCLLEDNIGQALIKYSAIDKTDANKMKTLAGIRASLQNKYDALPANIKIELSIEQFLFLQISKFVSDAPYYANLNMMLLDENNNLSHGYEKLLELMVCNDDDFKVKIKKEEALLVLNIADDDGVNINLELNISAQELPIIDVKITSDNAGQDPVKNPANPAFWKTSDAPLYAAAATFDAARLALLDRFFPGVSSLSAAPKNNSDVTIDAELTTDTDTDADAANLDNTTNPANLVDVCDIIDVTEVNHVTGTVNGKALLEVLAGKIAQMFAAVKKDHSRIQPLMESMASPEFFLPALTQKTDATETPLG